MTKDGRPVNVVLNHSLFYVLEYGNNIPSQITQEIVCVHRRPVFKWKCQYMIDDVGKWNDINELRKSLPNLGTSVSVDYMLEEIAVAEGSLSKRTEFITKYCNIKHLEF